MIDEVSKMHKYEFGVVGSKSMRHSYISPKLYPDLTLKRTVKGRPKSTRFLNEMDMREMRGSRCCGLYRDEGHSRSRCLNLPRQVRSDYTGICISLLAFFRVILFMNYSNRDIFNHVLVILLLNVYYFI